MKELLQKKTVKIGIAVIILAVAIGIISINARSAQRQREYDGHVKAAEKYLTDLDYEQAIAEYTLALEIEPNNEELLNALEQTYLDYAQSLADAGDYEKAVSVLEEGYAQTGRESLREKMEELAEQAVEENWQKIIVISPYMDMRRSGSSDSALHLSDAQVEELCRPVIDILEQYMEMVAEEKPDDSTLLSTFYMSPINCAYELETLYYAVGEYELCVKTREWIYEMTSDERYREGGITVDERGDHRAEVMHDQYGRPINQKTYYNDGSFDESNSEYGENGKPIKELYEMNRGGVIESIVYTYEYDSQGRIEKLTYSIHEYRPDAGEQDDAEGVVTYVYHEKGYTEHRSVEGTDSGTPWHITESRDYEIIIDIDENGGSIDDQVQVGDIY